MSPSQIRWYLASILIQNHQCSDERAKEIASYWVYGRASDFFQFDLDTFKGMFGDEIGMLFYLYSRGLTPGEKTTGRFWTFLTWVCTFFGTLFVIGFINGIAEMMS